MAALWWVIAAFVMAVLEVLSPALVFGTLVVAALSGAVVSWLGGDFRVQAVVASVVALVLLSAVRPLVVRRWKLQGRFTATGAAGNVGRPARVLAEVTELDGRVKVAGEEWTARSAAPGQVLPVGAAAVVLAIDGATAVVGPAPVPAAPGGPPVLPSAAPPPAPPGSTTPEEPRP